MTSPIGDLGPAGVFYAVSMVVSAGGGSVSIVDDVGTGCAPTGTLSIVETPIATQRTFYLSDVDYVSEGGQTGTVAYLPLVSEAIDVNRTVALSPSQGAAQITWGNLTLSNATGVWPPIFASGNVSLLPITISAGIRTYDPARGIEIDPPASDLAPAFAGVGRDWSLEDDQLVIPLDDSTRYLTRQIASQVLFAGNGGLTGTSNLAGRYGPTARGGTAANPICNVSPIEIDTVNWVFQYNTGAGTVVRLYVGGNATAFPLATSIGSNGDVADVYAQSVPQGQYVTCNAKGLIRFGSLPVGQVTLDVTGAFPSGASPSLMCDLVKALLIEELLVPAAMIDTASFAALPTIYLNSNPALGWYWSDGNSITGTDMLNRLLAGLNVSLITTRAGLLRLQPIAINSFYGPRAGALSEDQIQAVDVVALPADVATPTWKWQVGYAHCFTTQTATDINAQATSDYRAFVSADDRFAVQTTPAVALAFAAPGAPAGLTTAITNKTDAVNLAANLQSLFGSRRRSFLLTIGRKVALAYDIGDVVSLSWADAGLSSVAAVVVGEQFRSDEATTRLQVLI